MDELNRFVPGTLSALRVLLVQAPAVRAGAHPEVVSGFDVGEPVSATAPDPVLDARAPLHIVHVPDVDQGARALRSTRFDAVLLELGPDTFPAPFPATSPGTPARLAPLLAALAAPDAPALVLIATAATESQALEWLARGAQDYVLRDRDSSAMLEQVLRKAVARHRAAWRALQDSGVCAVRRDEPAELSGAILDTLPTPVLVAAPTGVIVCCNRACERIGGKCHASREAILWEHIVVPEQRPELARVFRAWAQGAPPHDYEAPWRMPDGAQRWMVWSPTVLLDDVGSIRYLILSGQDVTERRQAQERERQRLEEIAHTARLSSMGEMASEIAHELNQPLSAIINFCRGSLRVLDRGMSPTETRDMFERIAAQAERAVEIIRGIRRLLRKDTGARKPVDVNVLIGEMLALVEVEARARDVRLEAHLADGLAQVDGDPVLIEQVLLNLVRNAIEAVCDKAGERRVALTTAAEEGVVEVIVLDTGPGLAAEVAESVFEPFFTTKPDGMGMGLALSRSIVRSHGGELSVAANQPCGCRFRFTLPQSASDGLN